VHTNEHSKQPHAPGPLSVCPCPPGLAKSNSLHFYNVLLLVAIVCCFAVDTSICERGFSLMNLLKTAKRSTMGTDLLRMLMTICTLGAEWKDPTKILVEEIIDIWREESKGGRYLNKLLWGGQALPLQEME